MKVILIWWTKELDNLTKNHNLKEQWGKHRKRVKKGEKNERTNLERNNKTQERKDKKQETWKWCETKNKKRRWERFLWKCLRALLRNLLLRTFWLVVKWWCSTPHDQIFRNFIGFWRCHLDFKVSYFLQIKLKVIYFYI